MSVNIEELAKREPEDGPPFHIKAGRHYVAMWFVTLPNDLTEFGRGGDVTFLLWRKDGEPKKHYLLFRFRYYKTEGAWDGEDTKSWRMQIITGTEKDALIGMGKFFEVMCPMTGQKPSCMMVNGDEHAFFAAIQRDKPNWMQMRIASTE